MFEVEVSRRFRATHAIILDGVWEDLHEHDWGVWAMLRGEALDSEHLLIDFHALEQALASIVKPFEGATFNGTPPFDNIVPTAERVAEFVGQRLDCVVPDGVVIHGIAIEEAPGCIARWYPQTTACVE